MLTFWISAGSALFAFAVAFVMGRYVGMSRARREQRALAELSRALNRVLQKAFPRPGQQYSTIRREEAEELSDLLANCNRQIGNGERSDPN